MTWEELKREADYARAAKSSGSDYIYKDKIFGLDLTAEVGRDGLVVVNLKGETRLQDAVGLFGKAVLSEPVWTTWDGLPNSIYGHNTTLESISLEGMKEMHLQRGLKNCRRYVKKIADMIADKKNQERATIFFSAFSNAVLQADFSKMILRYDLNARDIGDGYNSLIDLSGVDDEVKVYATYTAKPDGRVLDWLMVEK